MNLDRPQLMSKAAFRQIAQEMLEGVALADLPELTTIVHPTLGPLTVVIFDKPPAVLVARGVFEDGRRDFRA